MNAVEIAPVKFVRMPFRLGVFFRWWNPGKPHRMPRVAARFFQWWIGKSGARQNRMLYRTSRSDRGGISINVGAQPLSEIGYGHNPDLPGHRWVEPMPCADDAGDSWDDAVYLGASWERFVDVDSFDPFRGSGAAMARMDEALGNEARWGRLQ